MAPDNGSSVTMTEVHGHRGCDDGVPPNTIPAFRKAADTGCPWLEMDVVLTGDGHVLISHEPWMDPAWCVDGEGRSLSEGQGHGLNIYRMPLVEVQRYRVKAAGGKGSSAPKPTLTEVVEALRRWSQESGKPMPGLNIEVKSDPAWYGLRQPEPAILVDAVLQVIASSGLDRCLVQSFDPAVLEAMHERRPQLPLALLIDNIDGPEVNLGKLRFTPRYYSAPFFLVSDELVTWLRVRGIGVLTWTVNGTADMQRMIDMGVDGLITDRPAEAMRLLAAR